MIKTAIEYPILLRFTLLVSMLVYPAPIFAQQAAEIALAKAILNELQPKSIRENREYCGYIGYDSARQLVASKAKRGRTDSCFVTRLPKNIEITASYHTHAGYESVVDSEVPSVDDMLADEDEGINGYISTPGGRLWFIDTVKMQARQLCPQTCMRRDSRFQPGTFGQIRKTYTFEHLIAREEFND